MTEPRKYRLIDWYEGQRYVVGHYSTYLEAVRAARQWAIEETDGECELALYTYNEADEKYHRVEHWHY